MIYLGLTDENYYNWTPVAKKYSVWIAQYNDMGPHYGFSPRGLYGRVHHWKKMSMFQYTANGRLNGYNGSLDLDVYYGSKKIGINTKTMTKELIIILWTGKLKCRLQHMVVFSYQKERGHIVVRT